MNRSRKLINAFFCISIVFAGCLITSCEKEITSDNINGIKQQKSSLLSDIPMATEAALSVFGNDNFIVHYKVARYYAYWEIENALSTPLNVLAGSYTLTERPVIIYDYDSRPKYYEFGIIQNGSVVATITTIAKKESSNMIHFMFDEPIDYMYYEGGLNFFVGNYPDIFYGIPSNPGNNPISLLSEDGETPVTSIPSCNMYENYQDLINSMNDVDVEDHSFVIAEMQTEINELNNDLDEFWINADAYKDIILNMSDSEIIADVNEDMMKASSTTWREYIIPYYNNGMKYTRWSGWCGPCAVAWAYRGFYTNYRKTSANYVPVYPNASVGTYVNTNDGRGKHSSQGSTADADYGLYANLLTYCVKTGNTYPMYQGGMNRSVKNITDNVYGVNLCSAPHDRIRIDNWPVFCMIGYSWSFYYLVGFGSGYELKKKNGKIKNKFLLVTDNGAATCRHNYAPYWRSQSKDPGIRYKWHTL